MINFQTEMLLIFIARNGAAKPQDSAVGCLQRHQTSLVTPQRLLCIVCSRAVEW